MWSFDVSGSGTCLYMAKSGLAQLRREMERRIWYDLLLSGPDLYTPSEPTTFGEVSLFRANCKSQYLLILDREVLDSLQQRWYSNLLSIFAAASFG